MIVSATQSLRFMAVKIFRITEHYFEYVCEHNEHVSNNLLFRELIGVATSLTVVSAT